MFWCGVFGLPKLQLLSFFDLYIHVFHHICEVFSHFFSQKSIWPLFSSLGRFLQCFRASPQSFRACALPFILLPFCSSDVVISNDLLQICSFELHIALLPPPKSYSKGRYYYVCTPDLEYKTRSVWTGRLFKNWGTIHR